MRIFVRSHIFFILNHFNVVSNLPKIDVNIITLPKPIFFKWHLCVTDCCLWSAGAETETLPHLSIRLGSAAQKTLCPNLQEASGARLQGLSSERASPWKDQKEGKTLWFRMLYYSSVLFCDTDSAATWLTTFRNNILPPSSGLDL
jgi:hypothetical protein